MNNRRDNKKGYWFEDEFNSFIRGYYDYESTYRDAMKFSIEIDKVSHNLFPLRQNSDTTFFMIDHPNPGVVTDLTEYFIEEHSRSRDRLYRDHFHLGGLLNSIMHFLVLYGKSFQAIDWGKMTINDKEYIVPTDFRYLSASTISINHSSNGTIKGYRQIYSPFAGINYDPTMKKVSEFKFTPDEILYTTYPLGKEQPVKKSMSLLKPIQRFWAYTVEEAESRANTGNHKLELEKARFTTISEQRRKYGLARAKVRRNFHYLLDLNDLSITEYYDIYSVARYKKELNKTRNYLIQEFNNQVFKPLAKKNKINPYPELKLQGFLDDNQIDEYFEKYCNGQIDVKEFIEQVVNKD